MSTLSKECLIAWWILVLVAFLLWYRNVKHDRLIAPILIVLGMMQLVNYACHNHLHPTVGGKMVIILIALLLFIIALVVRLSTRSPIATILLVISIIYMIIIIVDIVVVKAVYTADVPYPETTPRWCRGGGELLGGYALSIIIFIAVAALILLCYTAYPVELFLIIVYTAVAYMFAESAIDSATHGPRLVYYLSGLALVVWLTGYVR